jgi:hypothetical protein
VYVTEGLTANTSDPMMLSMKDNQAHNEPKGTAVKTIDGQFTYQKTGWWLGGRPPYGYDLRYEDANGNFLRTVRFLETGEKQVLDEHGNVQRVLPRGDRLSKFKSEGARLALSLDARVQVARRVFDMFVRGDLGYKAIAEKLNEEGIPSPKHGRYSKNTFPGWSAATIRSMVVNPIYIGDSVWNRRASGRFCRIDSRGQAVLRESNGISKPPTVWNDETDWFVLRDNHPAIIGRDTFEEVQRRRKEREKNRVATPYRSGRALKSPYLLSGLLTCEHCGHRFHGYTINSTKYGKNGERIKTRYYACGGAVAKGKAICERRLIRKKEMEADIVERIGSRVERFLKAGGDKLLRKLLTAELKADCEDPKARRRMIEKRIEEIDQSIDRLLDSLTPINKEFVDRKLVGLKKNREQLERELEELKARAKQAVDVDTLVGEIIAGLGAFEDIFEEGMLEEKKEFIRLFVEKIEVNAQEQRARVHIRKFPALLGTGKSSFEMVAGARSEHQKKPFPPIDIVELDLTNKGTTLAQMAA